MHKTSLESHTTGRVLAQTPAEGEQPRPEGKATLSMIMAPRSKQSQKLKAVTQHVAIPSTSRSTHKRNVQEYATGGAATERFMTDRKAKGKPGMPLRELSLSTSAQKIQTSIEILSSNGACDTSRTAQVQRKDAAIEQAHGRAGSQNSSLVVFDRTDDDVKGNQTVPTHLSKPGAPAKSKLSSQLQTRLMLSIDRISKTPALKIPATPQPTQLASS